jgi:hypothetical protein
MHTAHPITGALKTAITLAELLQRVESSNQAIGPDQYRHLVLHLQRLLLELPADNGMAALLNSFPAAAALYENLRYAQAGLCRSPLEASLNSELRARAAIDKARTIDA